MHIPLSQILSAGRAPGHPVAARNGTVIPFSQFRNDVSHNAERLRAAGCRCGAPVCRDSYWFLVGLLALFQAGAEVVIPPNAQPGTLEAFRDECDFFVVDGVGGRANSISLEPGPPAAEMTDRYNPAETPVHFFTSGSTGQPKRISRSAALLEREVALLVALWGDAAAAELVSSTVSHQHAYGLLFRLLWPAECGRPFSAVTHDVWETLLDELEPGGVLVTSPAHLTRLDGIDPIGKARAPGRVLSAGAPLSSDAALEAARVLGVAPTEMFGSTETGVCATRFTAETDNPWQPLPGVRFALTDGGLLKIQSPAVDDDTWYETADLVELLPTGEFRFLGRADRIVKIEGKRISLPDIEMELAGLPGIRAAAVILANSPNKRLAAIIVLDAAGETKRAELGDFRFGQFLRRELSRKQEPAGLPRLWRFVDALPQGALGKRRDADLATLFVEGQES